VRGDWLDGRALGREQYLSGVSGETAARRSPPGQCVNGQSPPGSGADGEGGGTSPSPVAVSLVERFTLTTPTARPPPSEGAGSAWRLARIQCSGLKKDLCGVSGETAARLPDTAPVFGISPRHSPSSIPRLSNLSAMPSPNTPPWSARPKRYAGERRPLIRDRRSIPVGRGLPQAGEPLGRSSGAAPGDPRRCQSP